MYIRTSVGKYEDEMSIVSKRSICYYYRQFVVIINIYQAEDRNDFLLPF